MKVMLPKEHGSWAVLIAPVVAGFAAAGGSSPAVILLFSCAALGGFLLRPPLQSLVSPKPDSGAWPSLALYGLLTLGGVLPLLIAYGRLGLLGFAAPAGALLAMDLFVHRGKRSFSMATELSGIAILCLGAPAAFYTARGSLTLDAWCVWALSALFFAGPVFHVKMAALQHRASADRSLAGELERMRRMSLTYHSLVLIAVVAAAAFSLVPIPAPLPFALALAKTWRRGARPPAKVDFRRLGYQEVGYSIFFALVLAAGYLVR
jgi:uncharacterized membrane protein YecN with MAPEG domain